ncbi:MAG: SusD/RagB family nutrient-binding outer membrane lipoprotein [Sphingobacteriales bacterium]|nr:SusD/RagB family nutrient-binding outer membrane lipoprotein [Sphingobacteriales bacterium]
MTSTGINLGSNLNRITVLWAQYWASGPTYIVDPTDKQSLPGNYAQNDRAWRQAYTRSLYDLYTAVKISKSAHQKGACQLMMAYNYQLLTDCYGDIPFSEALRSLASEGGIISPKFDDDAAVYAGILDLVNEAITNLSATDDEVGLDGAQDPMYGGDMDKWVKFANTLKLKVLLRQAEVNPSILTEARQMIDDGLPFIESNDENAQIAFNGGGTTNQSPLYASLDYSDRKDNYCASATTIDALTAASDPRIDAFYTLPSGGGPHTGILNGVGGGTTSAVSYPGPLVFSTGAPVVFVSAWESKFIRAEIIARTGGGDDETLFNEGVAESFTYADVDGSGYLAAITYPAGVEDKIKLIAYEKWVAMNAIQPTEAWIESRRYDTPTRAVFKGGVFVEPGSNALTAEIVFR